MRIDVNAFLGAYPFRRVPGTSPGRAGRGDGPHRHRSTPGSSHLPAVFWRDPTAGNARLLRAWRAGSRASRPVPAVHPGIAGLADGARRRRGTRRARRSAPIRRSTASTPPARDAGAGHRVWRGRPAAHDGRAAGGRAAAASQRRGPPTCRPSAVRALIRSDPGAPAAGHPRRPARSSRRCTSGRRRTRQPGSGGTSAGSGGRPRITSRRCSRRSDPPLRVRHRAAAPDPRDRRGQARPARPRRGRADRHRGRQCGIPGGERRLMEWPHPREHYRIMYPTAARPLLVSGVLEREVIDLSEAGIRFRSLDNERLGHRERGGRHDPVPPSRPAGTEGRAATWCGSTDGTCPLHLRAGVPLKIDHRRTALPPGASSRIGVVK